MLNSSMEKYNNNIFKALKSGAINTFLIGYDTTYNTQKFMTEQDNIVIDYITNKKNSIS